MAIPRSDYDGLTLLAAGGIASLGVVLAALNALHSYHLAVSQTDSVRFAFLENLGPVVLNLLLVGCAAWLLRTDTPREYAWQMMRWTGGILAVLLLVTGWGYLFRQYTHSGPLLIFADLVSICALAGIALGARATRREQRKETLQTQRSQFSTAFNNVPDATIGVDTAGDQATVVMANPAFEELFDVDAADVVGEPLTAFAVAERDQNAALPESDGEWGEAEVVLETGQERRTFLRLDGPDEQSGTPYDIYMDITSRRQQQERLSVLSRTLRHDIRNKMTVIKGNAATLRDNPDHPVREQMASSVDSAAEYILTMSERVYDIEQALSGPTQTEELNLVEVMEESLDHVREDYPSCEFQVEMPDSVRVNAISALPKALRELLENAAKHNDSDDPTVNITVDGHDADSVTLRVEDDGPGIPADVRQVITGEQDRSQLNHLDGLGLWFANWVVRDSGGRFDLQDRDPHGTRVEITLPRAD